MFSQRLRGLVNLHVALTTGAALLLLLAYREIVDVLPRVDVSAQLSLIPYLLCVAVGMIVSAQFVQRLAPSFHRLTLADAAWLATRQALTVALVVFAFMFAFKDRGMSRLFLGSYLSLCWLILIMLNLGLPRMLSRIFFEQARKVPTLFIGSTRSLEKLRHWLASKQALGLQPVGFLTLSEENVPSGTEPPFVGQLADLSRRIEDKAAVQVILLEIPRTQTEGRFIIETCQKRGARLLIYSNLADVFRHPLVTVTEEGHQFYALQEEPLEDPLNRVLKRLFDVALALPVVIFVLPPLSALVWLMQRVQSPGPLFFAQQRTGYGQRPFRVVKFRSMYVANPDETRQARRGDARIFPFGEIMRKTSIDEFPQFWNVLVGEMSIVGPRPHMPAHDHQFAAQLAAYRTRFFVKPGITGLAQCNGYRGEITEPALLQARIQHDLEYVTSWSVWLDLQIVIRTAKQVVFPPKSAY